MLRWIVTVILTELVRRVVSWLFRRK